MTSKIALLIGGTKQRQAGFVPLVSMGRFPAVERNQIDRPPLITDRLPYSLKHTQEYIIYKLTDRRVKSFDADASGVLCIAMAVDRHTQFAGGVSPVEVLRKVYDTFCERYMKPISDGRNSFQNMDIDNEVFRQLLLEYPLEDRISETYVVMNPQGLTGVVCLKEEELADFFRDTQYAEFAAFKDIEVGTACANQVSPELAHLKVPRPIAYQVYVNDRSTLSTLVDVEEKYTAKVDSTEFEEYIPVTFSLNDVISAEGNLLQIDNATVRLDRVRERIICQLLPKEICYEVVFDWEGTNEQQQKVQELMVKNEISLTLDDIVELNPHIGAEQPLRLTAKQAKKARVRVSPEEVDSLRLSVTKTCDSYERICRIRIHIKEQSSPKNVPVLKPEDMRKTFALNAQTKGMNNSIGQPISSVRQEHNTGECSSFAPPVPCRKDYKWLFGIIGFVLGIGSGIAGTLLIQTYVKGNNVTVSQEMTNDSIIDRLNSEIMTQSGRINSLEQKIESLIQENDSLRKMLSLSDQKNVNMIDVKQQILDIVKQCNLENETSIGNALGQCRSLWNKNKGGLSEEQKIAVEAILNLNQYKNLQTKKKIYECIMNKKISSWEDIMNIRQEIVNIINGNKR